MRLLMEEEERHLREEAAYIKELERQNIIEEEIRFEKEIEERESERLRLEQEASTAELIQ